MDIPKAIELLTDQVRYQTKCANYDDANALKLGIEALKYVQDIRHIVNTPNPDLLPGETKDTTPAPYKGQ